MTNE
ncbi:Protein of unknown function, partial [Gryllus bimaculatus]|jgi:hypothetical protein